MAPIYTARHTPGNHGQTVPIFKLRGLANLAPTTLSQTGIVGITLDDQPAYTQYTANIAHFIKASVSNTKVRIRHEGLGPITFANALPLSAPVVSFLIQPNPSTDAAEQLIKLLGNGASRSISGKTHTFTAPALPESKIDAIVSASASHFNTGRNAVTPNGLKAFRFLTGALGELLRVHSYAGFSAESEESIVEFQSLLNSDGKYQKFPGKSVDADAKIRLASSRVLQDESAVAEDDDEAMDDGTSTVSNRRLETAKSALGYYTTTLKDTVSTANPPRSSAVNIGPSSSIPNLPGLLFPYFSGLTQPDPLVLVNFTIRRLLLLLGNTPSNCQENFAKLRSGLNSLANHDVGMELSHIAFGIELALATQTRCFVIMDGTSYSGFSLLGARFAIFNSTSWVSALGSEDLRVDIAKLDPHASAVEELVELFRKMTDSDSYTGPAVDASTFESPSNLVAVFKGVKIEKLGDLESEVNLQLRKLNYIGTGYLDRNPNNIQSVLELIFEESPLLLKTPTYIPNIRTNLESQIFIGLSKFGPEAPSFWDDRGKDFAIVASETPVPSATGGKRKLGNVLDVYANMPEYLLISSKPLNAAVSDLDRVMDKGMVRMSIGSRDRKNRCTQVQAEEPRKKMWKVLVDAYSMREPVGKRAKTPVEGSVGTEKPVDLDALLLLLKN